MADISVNGTSSGPFVKVDGTLAQLRGVRITTMCLLSVHLNSRLTSRILADPPKFDLESYIANYTGKLSFG